jgi:DeoR family fructose operon transcriptional repressor
MIVRDNEHPPELPAHDEHAPLAIERRMRIADIVSAQGSISVAELIKLLGASPATVRRDLAWLDERGMITRTRGGAIAAGRVSQIMRHYDPVYERRLSEAVKAKQAIGRLAGELVQDGETIMVDAGSTTHYMIPSLAEKRELVVITNSLSIVSELLPFAQSGITVVVTGGMLRAKSRSFVGLLAEQALEQFFVDKAFLGMRGISIESGFTEPALEEIPIKRKIIKAAKQVFVLADHTKFGRTFTGLVAPLNAAYTVITDEATPEALIKQIATRGPQVLIAPLANEP